MLEVALIGIHKRFCDEAFFEKVYSHVTKLNFQSQDTVCLLTCNRIEIYLSSDNLSERHPELLNVIKPPFIENVEKQFYTFLGSDVLKHLAQVASGLDSLIYGESDIQHQVKKAYETQGRYLNKDGHFLFQKALHIAKKIRAEFDIKPAKSLVDQVVTKLEPFLNSDKPMAFMGNSELNQKIYENLKEDIKSPVYIVSRIKPAKDSAFYNLKHYHYQEVENIEELKGVIAATNCSSLDKTLKIDPLGFVLDLSRPKVLSFYHENYFDLSFFEKNSTQVALKQYALRLEALEYIQNNVKRLIDHRLNVRDRLSI